jgi:hypothetical protein
VQGINVKLHFACGICCFIHFITLQGYVSFVPHSTTTLSLHSVHSAAQTSATHASVVPSLHSVHCPPFVPSSNSFAFSPEVALYTTKTLLLNFTPAKSLHFVQPLPLLFHTQFGGMPCVMFNPGQNSSLSKYLKKACHEELFQAPRIFSHFQSGCYQFEELLITAFKYKF